MAALLGKNNFIQIQNILCSRIESAKSAVEFCGQGIPIDSFKDLKPAQIYFFCTPDDKIRELSEELLLAHKPLPNSIFLHFSGSLSSDVFIHAKESGFQVASLHPFRSFSDPQKSISNFAGTFCTYEGNYSLENFARQMVHSIEGKFLKVSTEQKTLYHAAAVFSSNYIVTIAKSAEYLMLESGIEKSSVKECLVSIMQSTIENIQSRNTIDESLTGPIQRGDKITIEKHFNALTKYPQYLDLYKTLGLSTLNMTKFKELESIFSK